MCDTHGGRAPQVKAAAKRRLIEAAATRKVAELEVQGSSDPLEVLSNLLNETVALKDLFTRWVADMESVRSTDDDGREQLDARVGLYERTVDRLARFAETLVKLGIDKRRLELDERMAAVFDAAMTLVLVRLGLTAEQQRQAPEIIHAALLEAASRETGT